MAHFPELVIDFYLVTRGDETELTQAAQDEVDKLKASVQRLIGHSVCNLYAVNTQILLEYVRKRKQTSKILKWASPPLQTPDGYVGLVKLIDYFEFLKDDDDELNETIFESNVRGYQGRTDINNAMAATLSGRGPLNFWLLNNGITIISSERVQPITAQEINIEDPQIVNGLQTSRKIFDYLDSTLNADDTRSVLVKVLPVADPDHRYSIIRATNSQNPMTSATLLATDYVHRQIEDLFATHELHYDRRPGFYRDQGCPAASIVGVTELVQALAAIIQARPDTARARPSDYINKEAEYKKLFGLNRISLGTYYKCISIVRAIETYFRKRRIDRGIERNLKYYVAYVLCVQLTGKLYPTSEDLLKIENAQLTDETIEAVILQVNRRYGEYLLTDTADGVAKGPNLLARLKLDLGEKYDGSLPPKRPSRKLKPRDVIRELGRL